MEGGNYISVTKDDGIRKKIIKEGTGNCPKNGQKVFVHYIGRFEDGKVFDQSSDPFKFTLGKGEVIKGWDQGVATMKQGEKSEFILKSDYAYGDAGYPGVIPKKATLIFEVEFLKAE